MCGISGIVSWNSSFDEQALKRMTNAIHHRGPDDEGYYIEQLSFAGIGFGFKRLSIIDLSPSGHQPMTDPVNTNVIVFNGEIYNYKDLKKELEASGHRFVTGSDTEVILKSYSQWGPSCVERFIGMFAFVIYDAGKKRLFGARDRLGVKPFYYHLSDSRLLFCSELKGIKASGLKNLTLDLNSVGDYMKYGYTLGHRTIYNEVNRLLPGHTFSFDLNSKKFESQCYWSYDQLPLDDGKQLPEQEYKKQLEEILLSAFSYRMIADVPVGIFLSGGIDSTLLAAVLKKKGGYDFDAFTIGFNESGYDESKQASAIASHLGIRHHVQTCTANDALELMEGFYNIYDEPFADTSGVPTYMVSRFAARHSKVALSADGSDEIFAGYTKYAKALKYQSYKHAISGVPLASSMIRTVLSSSNDITSHDRKGRLKEFLSSKGNRREFDVITAGLTNEEVSAVINHTYADGYPVMFSDKGHDPLLNFSSYDVHSYLCSDILYKVDMASMSNSLEVREPFLDHRILEFATKLPPQYKLRGNNGKWILKQLLGDMIPQNLFDRPKKGFIIPLEQWCRNEMKGLFMDTLSDQRISESAIFNASNVQKMKAAFLRGQPMDFQRLFRVFSFLLWKNKS